MKQAKPAAFKFKDYRISKFNYDHRTDDSEKPMGISFDLSGKFNSTKHTFTQHLVCLGKIDNHELFKVEMDSIFEFVDLKSIEDIPPYFYANSLGIIYPYIRAFVSTLTLQANCSDTVVLGLLNLTELAPVLKENTELID